MELLEKTKQTDIFGKKQGQNQPIQFPKVCISEPKLKSITCIQQCSMENADQIISQLKHEGALLYRDYDIRSPNQAAALLKQVGFVDSKCLNNLKLIVGTKEKQILNTQPLSMYQCQINSQIQHANIHNQFCQADESPDFVALYCFRPAIIGGGVSLINWKQLCLHVKEQHPDFLKKIQSEGINQITILSQNQNPQHNFEKGWKNSFKVANREQAQKVFKQKNYEFQWLENNEVRVIKKRKESEFYSMLNQILSFYKSCMHQKNSFQDKITFGNGQKIPLDVVKDICQNSQKYISDIELQAGDFLILNYNSIKYMHCPYEGPSELRKVYVSFMKLKQKKQKQRELFQILNNGYKMPLIGFGTWKIKKQQAEQVVYNAIKCGYRLIDCAPVYLNQIEVGKGIKKAMDQKIVKRQDLFITSKLWNTNHKPQHVRPACQRTLKDLDLEYLDLYLMHFPVSLKYIPPQNNKYPEWVYDNQSPKPYMIQQKIPVTQTWKAMEDLMSAKLVRNIGVSNFTVALLRQVIYTCQIKPEVLQTEIHPQLNEKKLIQYAREEGIQVTSYSSFGASSYQEIGFTKQGQQPIYKNEIIEMIGKKHNKSPHQIILRWAVQQGLAIIPKSVKVQRMKQNANITEFVLDEQDIKQIQKLHKGRRYNDPGDFCLNAFGTFYPLHQ